MKSGIFTAQSVDKTANPDQWLHPFPDKKTLVLQTIAGPLPFGVASGYSTGADGAAVDLLKALASRKPRPSDRVAGKEIVQYQTVRESGRGVSSRRTTSRWRPRQVPFSGRQNTSRG